VSVASARGDELLHSVEHEAVAAAPGRRLDRRGVGAGAGLGQAEGAELLTGGHRPQVALFLLRRTEFEDRQAGERVVHAEDGRAGAVARRDLHDGEGVAHGIRPCPTPLFRHHHAHQAKLARTLARRLGARRQLALRETARGVADQTLSFGQHLWPPE
jgi:hypothetical protein